MEDTPVIRRLDKATVNRIAAGEVIVRPANALKELVENSLDAKSTSISVQLKQGGLKVLQVQDNGCGIRVDDFPILCERFTTSKIKSFEDLNGIKSFGFRGEALASVSHVAHVTITSKTPKASCAYRASFSDGKMIGCAPGEEAKPHPVAGVKGTTILVEDLFYNIPIRRESLRSAQDEYRRCVDVMTKYSIHYSGVSFVCKKQGQAKMDVHTLKTASKKQNIRSLYGSHIYKELIDVKAESKEFKFKMESLATNPNFNTKSFIFILFINNRLVDCASIKKAIDSVYREYLPSHSHPFVYMSLDIHPSHVDVNVHPTKREVHFLHEEHVVDEVQSAFEKSLSGANSSRVFLAQSILPNAGIPVETENGKKENISKRNSKKKDSDEGRRKPVKRVYENKLVRTDSRNPVGSLDAYFRNPEQKLRSKKAPKKQRTNLTSVRELLAEVETSCSEFLQEVFANHTFVGCVNETYCLIQFKTKLYLVNVPMVSRYLVYERAIQNFGNFARLEMSSPAPIKDLLLMALQSEECDAAKDGEDKENIAKKLTDLLISKRQMMSEYFSTEISQDGQLTALPEIIQNYVPPLGLLPSFLLKLCLDVDWCAEKPCFRGICEEFASFYNVRPKMYISHSTKNLSESHLSLKYVVQHTICPSMRSDFHPPAKLEDAGCAVQVACLENLYKIFERC